MAGPEVSVIIPNFNKVSWIRECIEGCLLQGEHLREIIVVDDGSTDGSMDVLEALAIQYPEKISVYENPGKGANDARNFGFNKSTGRYIQWLDSDDIILTGKFEGQISTLEKSGCDIAYSNWIIRYYSGQQFQSEEFRKYGPYENFLYQLMKDNWTSPNNYLITRKIANKLNDGLGWNPKTEIGQDREYFTMAGILGAKFIYANGTFSVYNKQAENSISTMDFKRRLILNQDLEERFRSEIGLSPTMGKSIKSLYLEILDTHAIKACYYNPAIRLKRPVNPFRIRWSFMHWKMRLLMPWILIKKNFELLF